MEIELRPEAEAIGEIRSRRRPRQHDEALGVGERKRPKQDRVDDVEHPDHRPDGEGEGDD